MNRIQTILSALEEAATHPGRSVRAAMAESGKKAIGCFPYYTPDEIIHAAGLLPIGLWGGADRHQTGRPVPAKLLLLHDAHQYRAGDEGDV